MDQATIIGVDLAKTSFQVHGAGRDGAVVFRKKVSRGKLLSFLEEQPACVVAMEACASAHYWAREIGNLGHDVKLIPPIYVKPFVKRQKNDAAIRNNPHVPATLLGETRLPKQPPLHRRSTITSWRS